MVLHGVIREVLFALGKQHSVYLAIHHQRPMSAHMLIDFREPAPQRSRPSTAMMRLGQRRPVLVPKVPNSLSPVLQTDETKPRTAVGEISSVAPQ